MASEKNFEGVPPFPDNVPIVDMRTVSLQELSSGTGNAANQLMAACKELGFFLLDLRGNDLGDSMVNEIDQLLAVCRETLNLPDEVKQKYIYDIPRSFLGYKPLGHTATETKEPDRFEFFNVAQDGLMGTKPLQPLPQPVHDNVTLFTSFIKHCHSVIATISASLSVQLGLPKDTFMALQAPTKPSGTMMRLIKSFASQNDEDLRTSLVHHTDFGTLTLLVNVLGGLQILNPGSPVTDEGAWRWVRPQPGCLIINVGDALQQWTGGLLRSSMHRVRYAPGQQRYLDRYSMALLYRPEREASMKCIVGNKGSDVEETDLTAWEWEVKKAMSMASGDGLAHSTKSKATVAAPYA